jgi:predicted CxxxxCH...CXXCH cytochrome family protein
MPLSTITAVCTIEGISPLCQSRYHAEPKLEGETDDAYDLRTWRKHLHIKRDTVHIPQKAMHDALTSAAQYSKRKIPGQGKATWTQKFASGIALLNDIDLGIDPDTVDNVPVYCHSNGRPGSGSRVLRHFPIMPRWTATFEVIILDPIVTQDIFTDTLEQAGMYIGVGQNRPQNRGIHGRFRVLKIEWRGEQQPVAKIAMRA